MTAAEKIFQTSSSLKNMAVGSTPSLDSSSTRLNVADVSAQFSLEYYNTMSRQPDHLHGFYGKQSQVVHSLEGDLESPICTSLESIHARIMSMGFQGARIIVESIDAQASLNGGIFILTTGNMKLKSGGQKKFVQSFFLAEQPNGYYVLNDCFRFLEGASALPTPAAKEASQKSTLEKRPAEPAKVSSPMKAKPAVNEQAQAPAVVEKSVEKTSAPLEKAVTKPQAASKRVAEEPKKAASPKAPSSWASLAAGGSDMWQNGVVAPTKPPVVTVSSEPAKDNSSSARSYTSRQSNSSPSTSAERRSGNRDGRPTRTEQKPSQDLARSIFIRNISAGTDAGVLRKALEPSGVVTSLDLNPVKGVAFVEFETVQMAAGLIGSQIRVNEVTISIEARRPAIPRGDRRPRHE